VLRRKLPFLAETAPCPFEILAETLGHGDKKLRKLINPVNINNLAQGIRNKIIIGHDTL
jgi:hypothetical protein